MQTEMKIIISNALVICMLYNYLTENYSPGDIIKISDIIMNTPVSTIRWQLKQLVDAGELIRIENGIYCLPKTNKFGLTVYPDAQDVANAKYIENGKKRVGYFSGAYFANQLGISTQLPYELEIATNEAGNPVRRVMICGKSFVIRKSGIIINDENYKTLRLLDLLKNFENYNELENSEAAIKLASYISENQIEKSEVDKYLPYYPDRIYKNIYELGLYNVFA